jgi:hypothetical protein
MQKARHRYSEWRDDFLLQAPGHSLGFPSLSRESFHPFGEGADKHQQIFTSSGPWHLSKVHNQIFKRSSSNTLQLGWCSWPLLGIVFGTKTEPLTYCLTYTGELGDIKVLRPRWCLEWVPSWNCLTNVRASDSEIVICPLANFHHLPSRKLPSSVSNQACSVSYTMVLIQIRGTGSRHLSVRLRFVLLWGLLAWLPHQLFSFQNSCCLPVLVPLVCMTTSCLKVHTASSNSKISCTYLTLFPPS